MVEAFHYNFVKPHLALQGQTPADVAGVGVSAKKKWLGMLTEAVNNTHTTPMHEKDNALTRSICVFPVFFFFVPIIWMAIIPCQHYAYGYSSLSNYFFNVGLAYLNGKFFWITQSYANCV